MTGPLSLTDAERDFFLNIYRSAVDFYKPRIEKKIGVEIGDIIVCDYSVLEQRQLRLQRLFSRIMFGFLYRRRLECEADAARKAHDNAARNCSAVFIGTESTFHSEVIPNMKKPSLP